MARLYIVLVAVIVLVAALMSEQRGSSGVQALAPDMAALAAAQSGLGGDSFSSPEQLKNYLDQLEAFYAIAGRPRFGKRAPLLLRAERNF
ncbi:unnamed protein product [Meganyctiphanes norvegica]|uniref:Neuropeptide F n=1 Tax=Meganyctiphanes norvegica TaxID=48144 RepID=A0AAV2R1K2_MEGNR